MRCREFEDHVMSWLDGEALPFGDDAMRAHRDACDACRSLHAAIEGAETAAAPDLTARILTRTSGRGCERARGLLAADAPLDDGDHTLVATHLATCASCAAVARVVAMISRELPKLAWAEPDRAFLVDVLAATIRASPGRSIATAAAGGRSGAEVEATGIAAAARYAWPSPWQRIARRPRIALEGAYVGTLAIMLTVGLPGRSAAHASSRLYDGLLRQGARVEEAIAPQLAELAAVSRGVLTRGESISLAEVGERASRSALYARVVGAVRAVRDRVAVVVVFLDRQANRFVQWIASAWRAYVAAALEPEQESSDE